MACERGAGSGSVAPGTWVHGTPARSTGALPAISTTQRAAEDERSSAETTRATRGAPAGQARSAATRPQEQKTPRPVRGSGVHSPCPDDQANPKAQENVARRRERRKLRPRPATAGIQTEGRASGRPCGAPAPASGSTHGKRAGATQRSPRRIVATTTGSRPAGRARMSQIQEAELPNV